MKREKTNKMRIGTKVFAEMLMFVVLPCLLIFYSTIYNVKRAEMTDLENYIRVSKRSVDVNVNLCMRQCTAFLIKLCNRPEVLSSLKDDSVSAERRQHILDENIKSMMTEEDIGYKGHMTCDDGSVYSLMADDIVFSASDEFLSRIKAGGAVAVGDIILSESGEAYIELGWDIRSLNLGVDTHKVVMYIRCDEFGTTFESLPGSGEGLSMLIGSDDRIIASGDESLINSKSSMMAGLDVTGSGMSEIEIDGKKYAYIRENLTFGGWRMEMLVPRSMYFNSMDMLLRTMQISMLAASILLVIISIYLSRKITRPLKVMKENVRRFGCGDLEVEIPFVGNDDEIGDLRHMVDAMLVQIRRLIESNNEKQEENRRMEFDVLQAQINPHFIYNALDSISCIAKIEGQESIDEIVHALSDYLRIGLHNGDRYITVGEELQHVECYLRIQKIRWPEKFEWTVSADSEIADCEIIKTLIQPIVENCFKHGFDTRESGCIISIDVKQKGDYIIFEIRDNGSGFDTNILSMTPRHGFGILNTERRIINEYGEDCGVHYESEIGKGTTVTVKVKCLEAIYLTNRSEETEMELNNI